MLSIYAKGIFRYLLFLRWDVIFICRSSWRDHSMIHAKSVKNEFWVECMQIACMLSIWILWNWFVILLHDRSCVVSDRMLYTFLFFFRCECYVHVLINWRIHPWIACYLAIILARQRGGLYLHSYKCMYETVWMYLCMYWLITFIKKWAKQYRRNMLESYIRHGC